jgi:hypothetical protein
MMRAWVHMWCVRVCTSVCTSVSTNGMRLLPPRPAASWRGPVSPTRECSLPAVALAVYAIIMLRRTTRYEPRYVVVAALLALVGLGSAAFHGTLRHWAEFLVRSRQHAAAACRDSWLVFLKMLAAVIGSAAYCFCSLSPSLLRCSYCHVASAAAFRSAWGVLAHAHCAAGCRMSCRCCGA